MHSGEVGEQRLLNKFLAYVPTRERDQERERVKMKIVIEGGKIYPMKDKTSIENGVIVIRNQSIEALGPAGRVTIPKDCDRHWHVSGKTVLPGLIDAHLHVGSFGHPNYMDQRLKDTAPFVAIQAGVNARKNLDAGFTTNGKNPGYL